MPLSDQSTYKVHLINKLQNGVFWLIFNISKVRNMRFVGNLFPCSHTYFYNNDVIIMTPLVLKAQSPCEIFPPTAATLLGLGVTSKNEQVKQIRVNFYLFKTSNVNSFGTVDLFFNISSKFI